MLYNQTRIQGNSMPLLMGFTRPSKIEFEDTPNVSYYDQIGQIQQIDFRQIGTRSLKQSSTRVKRNGGYGTVTDRKNEIDDFKVVK